MHAADLYDTVDRRSSDVAARSLRCGRRRWRRCSSTGATPRSMRNNDDRGWAGIVQPQGVLAIDDASTIPPTAARRRTTCTCGRRATASPKRAGSGSLRRAPAATASGCTGRGVGGRYQPHPEPPRRSPRELSAAKTAAAGAWPRDSASAARMTAAAVQVECAGRPVHAAWRTASRSSRHRPGLAGAASRRNT